VQLLMWCIFRPTSLAWEVRKSSPGKSLSSSAITPSSVVSRSLTFNSAPQTSAPPPAVNRSLATELSRCCLTSFVVLCFRILQRSLPWQQGLFVGEFD